MTSTATAGIPSKIKSQRQPATANVRRVASLPKVSRSNPNVEEAWQASKGLSGALPRSDGREGRPALFYFAATTMRAGGLFRVMLLRLLDNSTGKQHTASAIRTRSRKMASLRTPASPTRRPTPRCPSRPYRGSRGVRSVPGMRRHSASPLSTVLHAA